MTENAESYANRDLRSNFGSEGATTVGEPPQLHSTAGGIASTATVGADGVRSADGSNLLAGSTVQIGNSGGLVFNITYDSSVSNAPAGFTAAIADVAKFYESVFDDPITVNLDVGWGEVAGQSLGGALGASETFLDVFNYGQVRSALAADATSADDKTALASLPISDPTGGGNFVVATAEAKALGLSNDAGIDGYVGFSSGANYTFDPNNRAVAGAFDFIGVAEHEISEVMGRIVSGGDANTFAPLDLFRYSSLGVRALSGSQTAYFSIDGGSTDLNDFNTSPNGDLGDWASGAGPDSYDAAATRGVALPVTATDLRVMDVIGWDATGAAATDTPPVVTPTSANVTVQPGQGLAAASLFTASDPDGDAITQYDFWDTGGGGGHFLVNGVTEPINQDIYVPAGQLAQTTYQAGSGTDTLWVRANDGSQWSAWSSAFTVTAQAADTPPVVTPASANVTVRSGQSLAASSLFTASDPDGDAITQYDFWDTGDGGGHFLVNGVTEPTNQDIYVAAGQLAQTTYQAGSGTDTLWVRANDGSQWSAWSSAFTVTGAISSRVEAGALGSLSTATSQNLAMASPIILTVGSSGQFKSIADAVSFADADADLANSYDIRVAPGTYTNDFPFVTRPVTIEADPNGSGPVVLLATEPLPNEKGIVLTTSSLTVRGLTFEGAAISNALGGNGAGIRDQNVDNGGPPTSLIVDNCIFVGNQEGILTGDDSTESIQIINSTFSYNGNPDPGYFQHALYVNFAGSLTVTGSLFGGQLIGHDIKSRAQINDIANNRIYDGAADPAEGIGAGSTSFGIEIADGGVATITNNLIVQGPTSENYAMVDYGGEGQTYDTNSLLVSGNTFINTGILNAIGIQDLTDVPVQLGNNTFQGVATPVSPPGEAVYLFNDTPPVVTPTSANVTVKPGQSLAAASLFTASDPDGDAITQYDFWDTGGDGGHFLVNGVTEPTNQDIYVAAAQLAQTTYQAGSGTDTLWVRANDGSQWSAWSSAFTVTGAISSRVEAGALADHLSSPIGSTITLLAHPST